MADQKIDELTLESGAFSGSEYLPTAVAGNRAKKRALTQFAPVAVKTFDMTKEFPGSAETFYLLMVASFAFTILSATYKTTAGTCTVAVKINSTNVTSLSALSLTSSETGPTAATGANSVALGDDVVIAVTSPAGMGRGILKLKCERA